MINGQEKNTFRWPVTTEEINNQTDKIICLVNAPFLISGCGDYSLSEEDYNTVIIILRETYCSRVEIMCDVVDNVCK